MESPGGPSGGGTSISDVVAGALPGILKRGRVIVSPYPFGLSDDDNMRVTCVNTVANLTVNIHTRRVNRDQSVTADTPSFSPPSDRTVVTFDIPLAGGYVTNLSCFATGAPILKGQCFVIVQMIRGLNVSATLLGTLLAGYITATQPVGWPGSPIESSTDGEPVVRTIVGTTPAAGAEWTETVPTGARWELIALHQHFQTSATASNRVPNLEFRAGANKLWSTALDTAQAASRASDYYFSQNLPFQARASGQLLDVPLASQVRLLAGQVFGSNTDVLQVGDQYSAPIYTVREWQEVG